MDPQIVFSEMTGRWYIATRYKKMLDGKMVASRKFDVTERINEILEEARKH